MRSDPAALAAREPAAFLRAVRSDDLATHHEAMDAGPSHAVRAITGVALGVGIGLLAAVLTPRPRG